MVDTALRKEVAPMPWKGVTVSEQRQRFLEDYQLNYYSITELADRFSISRTTAHKWIKRYKEYGQSGFHERSRRPGQALPALRGVHQAMKRPREIYQASGRSMPKRIELYDYPGHYLVRRVSRAGTIRMPRRQIFVSSTLQQDYVGP